MQGMILRLFTALAPLLLLLLLPLPAVAQSPEASIEGHWALRIDDATIFVFRLDQTGADSWAGAWKRPEAITSNGVVFRAMSGSEVVAADQATLRGDEIQLTFAGPQGDGRRDVLRFRLVSANQAQFSYQGIAGDPYPLIRVAPDVPLGPFDQTRIYDRDLAVTEAEFLPPASVEAELEDEPLLSEADPAEEEALPQEPGPDEPSIGADFLDDDF